MTERWRIVPTSRRTSKPDRVDIIGEDGRFIAAYVARSDALRMVPDPSAIADEAIGLFLELRDTHGHEEVEARALAVSEVREGCAVDNDEIEREMAAWLKVHGPVDPEPPASDLPF